MNITCVADKSFPASVRDTVDRLASARFTRFGRSVRSVDATVTDENGPRGGVDIRCQVRVQLGGGRRVVIRQTAATLREALSGAFERAGHTVAKKIHRDRRRAAA